MKISFSRYELFPRASLNSRYSFGRPVRRVGALLCVEEGWGRGYADVHPWSELGDLPLSEQLHLLRQGKLTPLTANSLRFAQIDGCARAQGVSAFKNLRIPESHCLVTDLESLDDAWVKRILDSGFRRIKVKVGRDAQKETQRLGELSLQLNQSVKFRLDFNASLDFESLENWLGSAEKFLDQIDFIEDPIPWDPVKWKRLRKNWRVRLACDREAEGISPEILSDSVDLMVVKPAVSEPRCIQFPRIFTSYLDHPFGQLTAAYAAAVEIQKSSGSSVEIGGFLSHTAYEKNEFSEQLQIQGAFLFPAEGTGFGFDSLLQSLNWEPLE